MADSFISAIYTVRCPKFAKAESHYFNSAINNVRNCKRRIPHAFLQQKEIHSTSGTNLFVARIVESFATIAGIKSIIMGKLIRFYTKAESHAQ